MPVFSGDVFANELHVIDRPHCLSSWHFRSFPIRWHFVLFLCSFFQLLRRCYRCGSASFCTQVLCAMSAFYFAVRAAVLCAPTEERVSDWPTVCSTAHARRILRAKGASSVRFKFKTIFSIITTIISFCTWVHYSIGCIRGRAVIIVLSGTWQWLVHCQPGHCQSFFSWSSVSRFCLVFCCRFCASYIARNVLFGIKYEICYNMYNFLPKCRR